MTAQTVYTPFKGQKLHFAAGERIVKFQLDKPGGLPPNARIAFKVKTNNYYRFSIVPNTGYLPCEVTVSIKPRPHRARANDMLQILTLVRRDDAPEDIGTIHKSNWRKVAHKQLIPVVNHEQRKTATKPFLPLPLQLLGLLTGVVGCFVYSALLQQQLRSVLGKSSEPLDRGVLSLLLLVQFMVNAAVAWISVRLTRSSQQKPLSRAPSDLPPRARQVLRAMSQPVRPLAALWHSWVGGKTVDWLSGMTSAASLSLWSLAAMLTAHWALDFVGQRMQSFARSSLVLFVALADVVLAKAKYTFGRLLSAAILSTGLLVFYWAKRETVYPGDWVGSHSGISVEGVTLVLTPVVLSTLVASSHRLLESQYRLGWAKTMLIVNSWMFLYLLIGIASSRPEVALADLIRALRVATLWWLCGAIEQMCLFVLLCGPTGGLGVSAVFALRQPFAAVVSTLVPLSAQWTGVSVMFTQWIGVAMLMVLGVAEVIAFYKRLDGRRARPGLVRAPGGNDTVSTESGFATPKAVKAGTGEKPDRRGENDDTKTSTDSKEFETKNPADHNFKQVISEAKKKK